MCCCCLLLLLLFVVAFNCYEISTCSKFRGLFLDFQGVSIFFWDSTRLPDLYMYDVFVGTELNNK